MATLKDKILQKIIDHHKIEKKKIEEAKILQKKRNLSFDRALIEKGLISEEDLLTMYVQELSVPFVNLKKYRLDPALQEVVPEKFARQYHIVPVSLLDRQLTIAVSDPLNVMAIDDLKNITGKNVDLVLSTSGDIEKAIESFYGQDSSSGSSGIAGDIEMDSFEIVSGSGKEDEGDDNVDDSEKAPIIRMVNLVLKEAIKQKASDVHMEPMADCMRVRYRIDGVLQEILNIPKENQSAVIVRIKIMSQLDITSNNVPQDGRFKLKVGTKEVDFRVSLLPTTHGQKIVMRILDKGNLFVGLEGLGVAEKQFHIIKEAIKKPFGMLLVTGPTGSGKSTTLYSLINDLNTVDRNIVTVEDPVEYLVEGLTQIQAHAEIGLTFAAGLRAILRQSPDVVMVGEIRDNETADIAIKASLTGQLVLSTLHTNDAPGALTRLVDMGVEPFLVSSSLVMVSAQRLCRKICTKCKEEIEITEEVLKDLDYEFDKNVKFYQGKGCEVCRQTGYSGRTCVTEILEVDDEVRNMLLTGKSSDDIKKYAVKEKGMLTLWMDALRKCLQGITTLEEVLRVTSNE